MPELSRHLRLTGGDCFMHGQDYRLRQAGMPGYICRVALRLEGGLDTELLRHRVAVSPVLDWLARARVVRPFPGVAPLWRSVAESQPVLFEHEGQEGGAEGLPDLPAGVVGRDLHPVQGPGLALDLVHQPDGTKQLVFSWNHMLMDARGAELILRHLSAENGAHGCPALGNLIKPEQREWGLGRWLANVKRARRSIRWLCAAGREPLFSLLPARPTVGRRRNLCRLLLFSQEETARVDAHGQGLQADFRRSHFYLAASVQALHRVAAGRGDPEGAYLVPVPHDLRRAGANGPIFSNHLSVFFYRIEARRTGSLGDTIGDLTGQMMDQMRDRVPESCMAALDVFKPMPLGFYLRRLGGPSRGKFASLCFSDAGETCAGLSEVLGGRILESTHWVPTWRPPGLTVLFWRFRGRQRVLLSWVDDCLSLEEMETFERGLRSALLGEEAP